jgi:5-methylcytosine-specific restriction endonuclease McrA
MIYEPIPEKCCTKCRQWIPATLEYFRIGRAYKGGIRSACRQCENEYARSKNNRRPYEGQRRDQYKAQRAKCYWCGINVGNVYHVDHVIPLSRGGSNGPENIVIACPHCNLSKSNRLPHEWEGNNGKLL